MELLKGKVALITGGASGIGEGAARRFVEQGARVAIADMQPEEGEKVCAQLKRSGGDALFVVCDVTDPESVRAAVEATVERFGRLDTVFANAGINGVWAPLDELLPTEWDRTLDTNLKGTYLTLHYAVPHLKAAGGGSVMVTSSVNGTRVFSTAGASAYSCSKAGQVALVKMAALELGRFDIRVNAICPGAIHTHIGERTVQRDTEKIAVNVKLVGENPLLNDGQGEPVDVADVCVFLASDLSRHVTGVELFVDGGSSLMR